MSNTIIKLNEKTSQTFSSINLEKFINSEDFEDLVLGYQMMKWRTYETQDYSSFKKELWL